MLRPFNGERTVCNKWFGKTGYLPAEESYVTINLKWVRDLNLRAKTIKLLKEYIGGNLNNISFDNDFLDMTSKIQATKYKLDYQDSEKATHRMGENIYKSCI